MKKIDLEELIDKITKVDYDYYYDPCIRTDIIEKAFEMERNYCLNCSDVLKDFSSEAKERRFIMYIKYLIRR